MSEGLSEVAADYDDSRWTGKQAEARNCQTRPNTDLADADHETTPHFVPPDTYPVLFADEYGYQAGNILWRGRFNATKGDEPTGAYLRVIGGLASGFSVYVNGKFLGAWLGSMTNKTGELAVSFQGVKLNTDEANILFVIQDTMGKEQREAAPDPRGILNATLVAADGSAANFTSWKVTGIAGANHHIDPVRGTYNEGGLHAERLGWHLPGYDDNKWKTGSPSYGFKGATARFYRTVVPLDVPKGYDASLSFTLHTEKKAKLRAQLYVNGYQYGKTLPYISNETTFPGEFHLAQGFKFTKLTSLQWYQVFSTIREITQSVSTSGPWMRLEGLWMLIGKLTASTDRDLTLFSIPNIFNPAGRIVLSMPKVIQR